MPRFRWSAVNAGGDVGHGIMEAPDRTAVVERLQRHGQIVLRAHPVNRRTGLVELLHFELRAARGLDRAALSEVTRDLAIMLSAGQDLDNALRFVVDGARGARVRAILVGPSREAFPNSTSGWSGPVKPVARCPPPLSE